MKRLTLSFLTVFAMLFVFLFTSAQAQNQVWTYDFGVATGSFTSSNNASTTFLPMPQANGGTSRVRIGTGGGGFALENPGSPEIGTFSQSTITGSSSSSDNLFQIYEFDGTPMLYSRFTFKYIGGNSGTFGFLFGNGENFGANTGYIGNSFAGFRSTYQSEGTILTERRTGSSWSDAFSISDIIDKDVKYTVEIYANNTNEQLNYYRNGIEHTLSSRSWSLWVDGSNFNDFGSVGLSVGDPIDGFLFFGQNSDDNIAHIEIDDIVYSNFLPDIRTIESYAEESEGGWRMLALPYDANVEQLARQNMIQGVGGGAYPGASPNIFTTHTGTSQDSDWIAPASLSTPLERGQGFIWALYDNANVPESKPLPMDLTIAGTQTTGNVSVSLSDANDGWNLLGNPFSNDLDISGIGGWAAGGSLFSNTAQIYDPATEGYILSTANSDEIAAFQGFFLQNNDATGLDFENVAATDATFYKEQHNRRMISFRVTADDETSDRTFEDRAFAFIFTEDSAREWDAWDAGKLTPLSDRYIGMAFSGERNGVPILKAQESHPFELEEMVSIPVDFYAAGVSGTAELSIHAIENIPAQWLIEMEDTQTGYRQVLREGQSFVFNFASTMQARAKEGNAVIAPVITSVNVTDETPRFVMHIWPGDEMATRLPDHHRLHQNYPNPFNPSTQIAFDLSEPSSVTLSVYDMLGRRVAVVAEGAFEAGSHRVGFDASGLSSGVYLYRLSAGNLVLSRNLTVLK